jgi:hypothetical protein
MEKGFELADVEVTPHPGLGMTPTSQFPPTGRTAPLGTGSVLNMDIHMDIHSASGRIQLDVGNKPWVAQPQNPRIQVRVRRGRSPG